MSIKILQKASVYFLKCLVQTTPNKRRKTKVRMRSMQIIYKHIISRYQDFASLNVLSEDNPKQNKNLISNCRTTDNSIRDSLLLLKSSPTNKQHIINVSMRRTRYTTNILSIAYGNVGRKW